MREIHPSVQKPSRYSGSEVRGPALPWEEARLRVLLAFPEVYEIGMSNLGILILHALLNGRPGTLCERVFAPWRDMEEHLRSSGTPLGSLETDHPARDFDVLGFSLSYELTYTNVLAMLDLAGIPLLARDRLEGDPLVIAGGVCTLNPAPTAPFFDALLVGDGEEAALEIAALVETWKARGGRREELREALAAVEGVYVPGVSRRVFRRILPDLGASPLLPAPILPAMRIVHDRLGVEIARGCTRGCRFCQAGYVYRPVRERDPLVLLRYLQETAPVTGFDEVGLLSLSAADYGCIDRLVAEAMETLSPERISLSLPSVRLDALRESTVREIRRVRKTGFTLAPEAGTEKVRRAINKEIEDGEIVRAAERIFANGWTGLKLYFMVGLPGETAEDVRAIGAMLRRVAAVARRFGKRNRVTASVAAFVPKPHTPFQWERQLRAPEVEERVALIKDALGRERVVDVKYHDPAVSELEGILSRGDSRIAEVILGAYRRGARFDGWTEEFRPQAWRDAFADAGIDPASRLDGRDPAAPLPWDIVDAGVDRGFLLEERTRARDGATTPDCRRGACAGCGVCRPGVANVTYPARAPEEPGGAGWKPAGAGEGRETPPAGRHVVRIRYAKTGPARYLSGLEVQSLWSRAIRRAGFRPAYSQGFNPAPKLSFSPALPVGTESEAEYLEGEFPLPVDPAELEIRLPGSLPAGIGLRSVSLVPPGAPRLSDHDLSCEYRIRPLPPRRLPDELTPERAAAAREAFRAAAAWPVPAFREGEAAPIDLKPLVTDFAIRNGELSITMVHGTGRGIRPLEAAGALLGVALPPDRFAPAKVSANLVPRKRP